MIEIILMACFSVLSMVFLIYRIVKINMDRKTMARMLGYDSYREMIEEINRNNFGEEME
jgi:hypothetical protein